MQVLTRAAETPAGPDMTLPSTGLLDACREICRVHGRSSESILEVQTRSISAPGGPFCSSLTTLSIGKNRHRQPCHNLAANQQIFEDSFDSRQLELVPVI